MRLYKVPVDVAYETPAIAAQGIQFTIGDAVYIDTSGFLAIATTSSKIIGFVMESFTATADNNTVKKYRPTVLPALQGVQVVMTMSTAIAQTNVGEYSDLSTVTTGAQVLNATTGATGQFFVLDFDPEGEGTTTDAVVEVAEYQKAGFAQA